MMGPMAGYRTVAQPFDEFDFAAGAVEFWETDMRL